VVVDVELEIISAALRSSSATFELELLITFESDNHSHNSKT